MPFTTPIPTMHTGDIAQPSDWNTYLAQNTQFLFDHMLPIGVILPYSGLTVPSAAWVFPTGQALSRTTYASLWDLYRNGGSSSPWGNGNGSTTFNVPDMKGKTPVGTGQGSSPDQATLTARALADQGGKEAHALALGETPAHNHGGATDFSLTNHTHLYNAPATNIGLTPGASNYLLNPGNGNATTAGESVDHTHPIAGAGGNGTHPNMQPFVVCNFILKVI